MENKPIKRKRVVSRQQAQVREEGKVTNSRLINQALDFRKAGLTWVQISEQMDIPVKTIWGKVHTHLDKLVTEPTSAMRQLHYERYNFMLSRLWPAVINGNTTSITAAVNVMTKIEKLYGLEAPARTENVNINVDPSKMIIGGDEAEYVDGMAGMAAQIDPALLARIPPHLRKNVIDTELVNDSPAE